MPLNNNPRLSDAIDDYLLTRQASGIAASTVAQNRIHLLQMLTEIGNIQVRNLTPRHIDMCFTAWVGKAPGTINATTSSLKGFFEWCGRRSYSPRGTDVLGNYTRTRKTPETARLQIPVDKFGVVLATPEHPRDRMILALGLYLFVRQSEMKTIRIGDIDFTNLEVAVTVHKTKQFDRMPISSELEAELRKYMEYYANEQGPLQKQWFLVPSKTHVPFHRDELGKWVPRGDDLPRLRPTIPCGAPHLVVQRVLTEMGYATFQEGVHTLRRSGARARFDALRDQGYDGALQEVRAMLHHASQAMTELYLGIHVERLRRNESVKGRPLYPTVVPARDKVWSIVR